MTSRARAILALNIVIITGLVGVILFGFGGREPYALPLSPAEDTRAILILDIGHGGTDRGASIETELSRSNGSSARQHGMMIEHAIAFDVGARLVRLIRSDPSILVMPTLVELEGGFRVSDEPYPPHEGREILQSNPPLELGDRNNSYRTGLNLRWVLPSIWYRHLRQEFTVRRLPIFYVSLHVDVRPSVSPPGVVIYAPREEPNRIRNGSAYRSIADYREGKLYFEQSSAPRDSNETEVVALSLASKMIHECRERNIEVSHVLPIRPQVFLSRTHSYIPAVLDHNEIPGRVLIELGDMGRESDRRRLALASYRQMLAEMIYEAIRRESQALARGI